MEFSLDDFKFRILLVSMIFLLLGYPYVEENPSKVGVLSVLTSVVLLAGLYSVSHRGSQLWIGLILAPLALLSDWWPAIVPGSPAPLILVIFEAVFFFYITGIIFIKIMNAKKVTADTLSGTVCVYLLLALVWTAMYVFMEGVSPGAFQLTRSAELGSEALWSDLLYFSFTALTTVGYGDISPVTSPARSLASLESVTGVLYLAIIIGKLIGVHLSESEQTH